MLDTNSLKPLYIQLEAEIRQALREKKYLPGDRLPSEEKLCEQYQVSRITVRKAIQQLTDQHILEKHRGKGTFVTFRPKIKEELSHIRSFTDEMTALGRVPGTQAFHITKEIPNDKTRELFGLPEEMMYCVRRVRTADDVLLVYFVSYFPLDLDLPLDLREHTQSVYEVIGSPARIDEEFSAVNPSEEVCLALKIRKDQPVLARNSFL